MMYFSKTKLEAATKDVAEFANIEVTYNESDIFVIADNSQAINEFETRLAAQNVIWEGESVVDAADMLRTLTDIQGVRTEFRERRTNDEWQARYSIVAC